MAIGTDDTIDKFGTEDTVSASGGTSAVTDGSYSAAADGELWTHDDDSPLCGFKLKFQYPSGTIDRGGVHLFAQLQDINSTNDEPQPDSGWPNHYLGTFPTDSGLAATTDNYLTLGQLVRLPNHETSQIYKFYIQADCNVTLSAGWTLTATPVTLGPSA